ncbi:MAG: hypothetical protein IPH32_13540 [Bacteroidetes bacterium]|nr:hypothetical protein [Bacteroidota bacterium]
MGGVKIMPNGNYLISEGSSNRVVEINQKKEILWDFSLRQVDSTGKVNDKFEIYRANFLLVYILTIIGLLDENKLTIFNKRM